MYALQKADGLEKVIYASKIVSCTNRSFCCPDYPFDICVGCFSAHETILIVQIRKSLALSI